MSPSSPRISVYAAVGAAIAGIFAFDLQTPLGLGVPFLYLLVVLFAIWARVGNHILLAIVSLCTALAAFKLAFLPAVGVLEFGQGNRVIFAVLVWALLGLELIRRQFEAVRQKFSQDLTRLVQERTEALHRANLDLQNEVAERKQAEGIINDYAERLHGLADQLVEAQEKEREHLAAELHDRIGQNLSALNISLNLNLAQLPSDTAPAVTARMRDALQLVERTTEIVRGVMEELHPALLDLYGLDAALRWYGEEFTGRTGIHVANEATELFPRLRAKVEMTLFRIVQEALTNVAKHAGAEHVAIALKRNAKGIQLTVADDGAGFDPAAARSPAAGSGWGLELMAERARSIGADFRIGSLPDRGTSIVVNIANGFWEVQHANHGTHC